MSSPFHTSWREPLQELAIAAGALILRYRDEGRATVEHKQDNSPVTAADKAADALICEGLRGLDPSIPIISEEGTQHAQDIHDGTFWCVDPLDGTKAFVRGEVGFTVNIALIVRHVPVFGVIYLPVTRDLYVGLVGEGAWHAADGQAGAPIAVRTPPAQGLHALTSMHHGSGKQQELAKRYGIVSFTPASSSLKFCYIAQGRADIYPRLGPTMEWDTAAGQAIVSAAGGYVFDLNTGEQMRYAKPEFLNPNFVVTTTPHLPVPVSD